MQSYFHTYPIAVLGQIFSFLKYSILYIYSALYVRFVFHSSWRWYLECLQNHGYRCGDSKGRDKEKNVYFSVTKSEVYASYVHCISHVITDKKCMCMYSNQVLRSVKIVTLHEAAHPHLLWNMFFLAQMLTLGKREVSSSLCYSDLFLLLLLLSSPLLI